MKVAIGTTNKAKVKSIQLIFPDDSLIPLQVSSGVSAQPLTDEETFRGAKNRAVAALKQANSQIGIGLEGGVVETNEGMYLCNWGALATREGKIITAGGARIHLPDDIANGIKSGEELSKVMEDYTNLYDVRSNQGAVGIFTDGYVDRSEMFYHVVKLLKGQYSYYCKMNSIL
ncbi:DUF84 family protein [Bacillus solimangrovi]|uniref:inosine/xanthosine triphosphatase n=1 Tax=Bacillus solimangrovi TaxID=1305675 RepID=A0A1E5LCH2_9BACI|nr:DUF84 family protein [Bacillus solimangrovi]OEH91778.1 inosine/xanthosine triphosphatase [Bacillus solimangrovi]